MGDDKGRNTRDTGKNLLIVVLILVCAVQAVLLFSRSNSDFMEKGPAAYEDNETAEIAPENGTANMTGEAATEEPLAP